MHREYMGVEYGEGTQPLVNLLAIFRSRNAYFLVRFSNTSDEHTIDERFSVKIV